MSRAMIAIAPVMLIAGLSMGAGVSSLYWSGVANRGFQREAEWKSTVDVWQKAAGEWESVAKRFEGIATKNLQTAQRCIQLGR